LRGHCRPLGLGHELGEPVLDQRDALVERQGLQLGRRQPQAGQRIDGGPRAGGGLAQPSGQLHRGLFDLAHGHACQITGALEHLDALDRGVERSGQFCLTVDHLQPGTDHRGGRRRDRRCGCRHRHPRTPGEGPQPGVRPFHLARQTTEAPGTGLANALKLRLHLTTAGGREAYADASFRHGSGLSGVRH